MQQQQQQRQSRIVSSSSSALDTAAKLDREEAVRRTAVKLRMSNRMKYSWVLMTLLLHFHLSSALPLLEDLQQPDEILVLIPDSNYEQLEAGPPHQNSKVLGELLMNQQGNSESIWVPEAAAADALHDQSSFFEPRLMKRSSEKQRSLGVYSGPKSLSQKRALSIFMALPDTVNDKMLYSNSDTLQKSAAARTGKLSRPYGMPLRWG